jgi:hypothetical protein
MTTTDTLTTTSVKLRALADLIDAHPDLPSPCITSFTSGAMEASWYLHVHGMDLTSQKATATRIVRILGGQWDKRERSDDVFMLTQVRDGITLDVQVNRAAVCKRVVTGTHEVTVPSTPARPAMEAEPERTEQVEDVTWVCSSLLADEPVSS